jgi:hypothetical protein
LNHFILSFVCRQRKDKLKKKNLIFVKWCLSQYLCLILGQFSRNLMPPVSCCNTSLGIEIFCSFIQVIYIINSYLTHAPITFFQKNKNEYASYFDVFLQKKNSKCKSKTHAIIQLNKSITIFINKWKIVNNN